MKKITLVMILLLLSISILVGCSSENKSGKTYTNLNDESNLANNPKGDFQKHNSFLRQNMSNNMTMNLSEVLVQLCNNKIEGDNCSMSEMNFTQFEQNMKGPEMKDLSEQNGRENRPQDGMPPTELMLERNMTQNNFFGGIQNQTGTCQYQEQFLTCVIVPQDII